MKPIQNTQDEEADSSSCDLDIIVEGKQYGAHWYILREKSEVFEEFYRRKNRKEKPFHGTKTCVHLRGVSSKLVGLFLQYVYTSSPKCDEDFQLDLNEINDVLQFSIMFKLKDLEMGKSTNSDLEAQLDSLDRARRMSKLHQNLLQFLYTRTTVYKRRDIAKFAAHKAYTAANMECLFEVLKIVSCNSDKITMRLRLLDILITLFTVSLDQEVIEVDMKGQKGVVKDFKPCKSKEFDTQDSGKSKNLKPGLINEAANPQRKCVKPKLSIDHQENDINRKFSSRQNSKKLNENINIDVRNANTNKISREVERQRKGDDNNFVIGGKVQNNRTKSKPGQQLCSKPVRGSPANRRIALIKEHLERINEHIKRVNAKGKRVHEENTLAKSRIPRVLGDEGHDLGGTEHVFVDEEHDTQGNNERVCLHDNENNSNLTREYKEVARDYKEVARDTNMMRQGQGNEMQTNINELNDSKPESRYEQEPAIITRKIRKMWTKDFHANFAIMQSQGDKSMYKKKSPDENPQSACNEAISNNNSAKQQQALKCEEIVGERIYITGGIQKNDYFAHKAILELNPETGSYTIRGGMGTGRYNHGIAQLENEIYLVGGNSEFFEQLRSVESYCSEYEQWTVKPSMHEARDEFSLVVCAGSLYAIGGHNGILDLRSVEKFNARENAWSFVSPMRNYRAGACAVAVDDKSIYVIGGFNGQTYLTSVEQYDVTADVWIEIQPISSKRAYSCSVLFKHGIYIFGGFDGQSALSSCEMYDIKTQTWKTLPDMHTPRMNATAVACAGGLFVFGGECDNVFLETVECCNMKNKTWSFVHRLPQPMAGLRACVYLEKTKTQKSTGN